MKKTLVLLGLLTTMLIGANTTFAACPCAEPEPCCPQVTCPCETTACPCEKAKPCCEPCDKWLCNIEDYFCRIGLDECQKAQARKAVDRFICRTQNLNLKGDTCACKESKCDCRAYRKALKKLDCDMKRIITSCQKANYSCVRKDVKCDVKKCHHCLISPFPFCKKCACK